MSINSSFTELATVTLNNYSRTIADNVSKHNPLLLRLMQRGNNVPVMGGDKILQNLDVSENGTFTWYSGAETLSVSASEVLSVASFDWKQANVNVVINGLERIKNAGREQKFDLLKARIANAERTIKNSVAAALFYSNTENGGKAIGGLQHLVPDLPTSGVVGGIDASAYPFWQSKVYDFSVQGVTASKDTIVPAMNYIHLQTHRGTDEIDMWIAGATYFGYFETKMQEQQRFTTADNGNAGFPSYKYKKADVFYDSNCSATRMYGLNTNFIHFRPSSERNFVTDDQKAPVNQDALVIPLYWAGNMTVSNRALQGVICA